MPANRFNAFTDYGVGIGLRVPHYNHILSEKPVVDWFEIISENYMVDGGRPLKILDQILEQYRVVQHGVSMYFGSAQALDREHLRRLKALTRRTRTPVAFGPPVLGQRRRTIHARSAPATLYFRSCANHRTADSAGAGLSRNSNRGRERKQLRRISRIADD